MARKSKGVLPNPTNSGVKRGRKKANNTTSSESVPRGRPPRSGKGKDSAPMGRRDSNLGKQSASASNQAVTPQPPTKQTQRHVTVAAGLDDAGSITQ